MDRESGYVIFKVNDRKLAIEKIETPLEPHLPHWDVYKQFPITVIIKGKECKPHLQVFGEWLAEVIISYKGNLDLPDDAFSADDLEQLAIDTHHVEDVRKIVDKFIVYKLCTMSLVPRPDGSLELRNTTTIEERFLLGALTVTESHFAGVPPIGSGPLTRATNMIAQSMQKSLNSPEVRQSLAKNVDVWMKLQTNLLHAVPSLSQRSLLDEAADSASGVDFQDTAMLISTNHPTLIQDLKILNDILVIARNLLAIKEIGQEICMTAQVDEEVERLIAICMEVTTKGYDGENMDSLTRSRVNEVTEYYKKILVTSLQLLHNLTMGNDYMKMKFFYDILFHTDLGSEEVTPDGPNPFIVREQMKHWLDRNSAVGQVTQTILDKYTKAVPYGKNSGPLPTPLYEENKYEENKEQLTAMMDDVAEKLKANVKAHEELTAEIKAPEDLRDDEPRSTLPIWSENEDTAAQDKLYGRVSHEIDIWWKKFRDPNYESWVVKMETVDNAKARAEICKANAMTRFTPHVEDGEDHLDVGDHYHEDSRDHALRHHHNHEGVHRHDDGEPDGDEIDEEEEDDDDSYIDPPLRGLFTEVPNILDAKQIEALHMTIKACIVDNMGNGLTKYGENLQKTRCKLFLALQCGKNLLREMLVFIAVWEQSETDFIFQITAQIIESFHHNALVPYAWKSLRILKDIVSPAQTVFLRLINYMFRARKNTTIYSEKKDWNRDAKLIHFLFNYFRCRVVPDCLALLSAQAQVRTGKAFPQDFPVDLWDMERAKDGLWHYLDFLSTIADTPEMRTILIEWEATYELLVLLDALDAAVERKPLVDPLPPRAPGSGAADGENIPVSERPYDDDDDDADSHDHNHGLPPLHDTPHKFPWSGVKIQILIILTTLVSPWSGPSDIGNPDVQKQILKFNGMPALLNCLNYDGHNMFLKERATLCLKWVTGGCDEAQQFVREMKPVEETQQGEEKGEVEEVVEVVGKVEKLSVAE